MIKFVKHPDIAPCESKFNPAESKTFYRHDYEAIFRDVAAGKIDQRGAFRSLILDDLFFIVHFVMEIEKANHPFVVARCHDVQNGPQSDTLDIWARFHWKSTLITIAETIQYHLRNPEHCTGIHCYNRPLAKDFLQSIKETFETKELLKYAFPDIVWDKPQTESPSWSLDGGITLKRKSTSRKEATIEAWGLVEGQATGRHFERNVFDDLETIDIKDSPDQLDKCFSRFEMSLVNLGTGSATDSRRAIGTYYSHFGPNVRIRDMKYPDGRNMFQLRLISGSVDGTREGRPVLMDAQSWEMAKGTAHFNSQQLCDPTPSAEMRLNPDFLKPINPKLIPKDIYKFLVLDQAGGDETDKQSKDMWSYGIVGIKPSIDEIGTSDVYLMDVEADQMSHSEGINGVVRMYVRNGLIHQLGVEKVGLSTTEIHISNALRAHGRRVSLANKNLVLLKPAGRSKAVRIEAALAWPLNNGKLYYSTDIHEETIEKLKEEMKKFPFFHVDILDMWAYAYDIFKQFQFIDYRDEDEYEEYDEPAHGISVVGGY